MHRRFRSLLGGFLRSFGGILRRLGGFLRSPLGGLSRRFAEPLRAADGFGVQS